MFQIALPKTAWHHRQSSTACPARALTHLEPRTSCVHAPLSFTHPQYGSLDAMQALGREEHKLAFMSAPASPLHRPLTATTKHVLFAFAVALATSQRNLDDAGGEGDVQGAAGLVKLHAHDPLVLHAVVAAPGLEKSEMWLQVGSAGKPGETLMIPQAEKKKSQKTSAK